MLPQRHGSNASSLGFLQGSDSLLSHLYMTTEKNIALSIRTFESKVMPLHFNTLSRFVVAFLPRSKHLLISWLQSLSTVILELKKIKSVTVSIVSPSICSYEIKRHLLLGRKAMTNLDSILKSRDITLPTKICLVKAMVFPVVMYECESWTMKKAE